MRIVFLHPHFTSIGGAGRMVLETSKRLSDRGHLVDIVCLRADPAIIREWKSTVSFHETNGPLSSSLRYWIQFRRMEQEIVQLVGGLVAGRDDAVLFPQVFPANWWGQAVLQRIPSLPAVWYCQEPSAFIHSKRWRNALPFPKNRIAQVLRPWLASLDIKRCRQYESVLANSDFSRGEIQATYGYPKPACKTVYLGVDHDRFFASNANDRQMRVCTIAKLTRFKNIDILISALSLLSQRDDQELHLDIIGEGDAMPSLKRLAERLNLSQQVTFHGRLDDEDVAQVLRDARVFCLASESEPFGLVTIEALACGTPVVAMNSGGPREVLSGFDCGWLVDRPNAQSLADALSNALNDSNWESRSRSAVLRAADFHWDATTVALERQLQDRIASHQTGASSD